MACYKPVKSPGGESSGTSQRPVSSLMSSNDFNLLVLKVIPGMNDKIWASISFSSDHNLDEKHEWDGIVKFVEGTVRNMMSSLGENYYDQMQAKKMRAINCKSTWEAKLGAAQSDEKQLTGLKPKVLAQIAKVRGEAGDQIDSDYHHLTLHEVKLAKLEQLFNETEERIKQATLIRQVSEKLLASIEAEYER